MTNDITTITPDNVPQLTYEGHPVVTSSVLAQLYGAEVKHIQNNYKRNEDRFESGKHFYKVEGNDLKELKKQPSLRGLVSKMVSHLILWTERGAARHAKMLETNQAWDVFEALEDYYFGKSVDLHSGANSNIPALPSPLTPQHQHGLKSAVDSRAMQFPKEQRRMVYSRLWNHVKDTFEVARYQDIDDDKYQQALATVNLCPLEGELLERDMPTALVTLDIPHRKSWQNYTVGELIGDSAPYSDLSSLMNQLNEARKTEASIFIKAIDGAFEEMKALRSLAERFDIKAWGLENRLSELRNHARAMQRISEYS